MHAVIVDGPHVEHQHDCPQVMGTSAPKSPCKGLPVLMLGNHGCKHHAGLPLLYASPACLRRAASVCYPTPVCKTCSAFLPVFMICTEAYIPGRLPMSKVMTFLKVLHTTSDVLVPAHGTSRIDRQGSCLISYSFRR